MNRNQIMSPGRSIRCEAGIDKRQRLRRVPGLAVLFALMGLVQPAGAQFMLPAMPAQRDPIDMWVLRGQNANQVKSQITTRGTREFQKIKNALAAGNQPLTPEQESKLMLSVEGTASGFIHEVTLMRATTSHLDISNREDQQKAMQLLQPMMQQSQTGFFGKDSVFWRMVNRVLDTSQRELLAAQKRAEAKKRTHALNLRFVAALDERLILVKAQRDKLVDLMDQQETKETPPGWASIESFLKIMQIPEDELKKVLDAEQMERLQPILEPYRNINIRAALP